MALALRLALEIIRAKGISSIAILSRRGTSVRKDALAVHWEDAVIEDVR